MRNPWSDGSKFNIFQSNEVLSGLTAVNVLNSATEDPGGVSASAATRISDIGELQIVTTPQVEEIYETPHETTENYVDVEVKDGQRIRLKVPSNIDPTTYGREYLQSLERQEQEQTTRKEGNPWTNEQVWISWGSQVCAALLDKQLCQILDLISLSLSLNLVPLSDLLSQN